MNLRLKGFGSTADGDDDVSAWALEKFDWWSLRVLHETRLLVLLELCPFGVLWIHVQQTLGAVLAARARL
eukprot:6149249-Karenia_brevis.AAC.1